VPHTTAVADSGPGAVRRAFRGPDHSSEFENQANPRSGIANATPKTIQVHPMYVSLSPSLAATRMMGAYSPGSPSPTGGSDLDSTELW